jgi:hypothetical protein
MSNEVSFEEIAGATNIGHLGIMTPDDYPRVVPINFATIGDRIYFHGARKGEKYETFAARQKVTLSIDLPHSMIPSYWQDGEQACRANQFFKSALIRGYGAIVDDPDEKAAALQALMEKHQPEGGFRTITPSEEMYRKSLAGVTIFRIDSEQISIRCEMGQRLSTEIKAMLVTKLEERASDVDLKTAAELKRQLDQEENSR